MGVEISAGPTNRVFPGLLNRDSARVYTKRLVYFMHATLVFQASELRRIEGFSSPGEKSIQVKEEDLYKQTI